MADAFPHPNDDRDRDRASFVLLLLLKQLLAQYPLEQQQEPVSYGTAGFRMVATQLPPVIVRVGLVVGLGVLVGGGDKTSDDEEDGSSPQRGTSSLGMMITASHNSVEYNGLKLAGTDGGMLQAVDEATVERLVNALDVLDQVLLLLLEKKTTLPTPSTITVHVGMDTRPHSLPLMELLVQTLAACGCTVVPHGLVTTPQLHHCVRQHNGYGGTIDSARYQGVAGYYDMLITAYQDLLQGIRGAYALGHPPQQKQQQRTLLVDCACGVGYPAVQHLSKRLQDTITLIATNQPSQQHLNDQCGSEFVQKQQQPPRWYDDNDDDFRSHHPYCCSLDGDADRIVFFTCLSQTPSSSSSFRLLDGDKLAALICGFIQSQLQVLLSVQTKDGGVPPLTVGVVQTAYANGASTAFLKSQQGIDVTMTKTGVKHLHHAALQYDVGIYFEANGHGTVLFSDKYHTWLNSLVSTLLMDDENQQQRLAAHTRLLALPRLINQAVGDALSDMLLVDAILQIQHWTLDDWYDGLYHDLPSQQAKVVVPNRRVVVVDDETETQCLEPVGLQAALDAAVVTKNKGRVFVRPSGTEDAVRVYAEAQTITEAQQLCDQAVALVQQYCGVSSGGVENETTATMSKM